MSQNISFESALFGFMATCSCLTGEAIVRNGGDFVSPTNMFVLLIGPPGSNKSAAIRLYSQSFNQMEKFFHEGEIEFKSQINKSIYFT